MTELVDDYAPGLRLLYVDWKWSIDSIANQFECEPHNVRDALRRLDIPVTDTNANTADANDAHATSDHGHLRARGVVLRQQMINIRDAPDTP